MGGVVEFVEQVAVRSNQGADQTRHGEHNMPMGHSRADGVGDERGLGQGAALVATGAQAALLAGEGEEKLVAAVRAVQAG